MNYNDVSNTVNCEGIVCHIECKNFCSCFLLREELVLASLGLCEFILLFHKNKCVCYCYTAKTECFVCMVNRISKLARTVNYEAFWSFRGMDVCFWKNIF